MAAEEKVTISIAEFAQLQSQLMEFKQLAYDAQEKEKKATIQLQKLQQTKSGSSSEGAAAVLGNWLGGGKQSQEVDKLKLEIENLKRSIQQQQQEFREQSDALRGNLRDVMKENEAMVGKVKTLEAALEEKQAANDSPSSPPLISEEELNHLKEELNQLESTRLRLKELDESESQLRSELATVQQNKAELASQLEEAKSALVQKEDQNQQHSQLINQLQNTLTEKEKEHQQLLAETAEANNKEKDELLAQISHLKNPPSPQEGEASQLQQVRICSSTDVCQLSIH
jgi:DNA repair exonuclease SbcCD ATPase subunit